MRAAGLSKAAKTGRSDARVHCRRHRDGASVTKLRFSSHILRLQPLPLCSLIRRTITCAGCNARACTHVLSCHPRALQWHCACMPHWSLDCLVRLTQGAAPRSSMALWEGFKKPKPEGSAPALAAAPGPGRAVGQGRGRPPAHRDEGRAGLALCSRRRRPAPATW